MAATLPFPSVEILLKSIASGKVLSTNTDNNGNFNVGVPEESGAYNLYIGNESLPPVKISAKKNTVSGRVVILTEGTTTKDPTPPAPIKKTVPKKTTPVKKSVSPAITKPKLP